MVEAHRQAMQDRIQRLRGRVLDTLRAAAPDLVTGLDPAPPPVRQGYQLLPRLIDDLPQPADTGRRASLYSWPWTDTLIQRGETRIDSLSGALARGPKSRAEYQRLVSEFNGIVADRRLIDAHVEHNWFWQRTIAADTVRFVQPTRAIASALAGIATPAPTMPAFPRVRLILDDSTAVTTIHVPLLTDIEDTAFVHDAQSVIERLWSGRVNGRVYRVVLDLRFVEPRDLYCRGVKTACSAPAMGAAVDLPTHVARFGDTLAVLTTGGTQPHVLGGRAMILGPRDVTGRTLAHEFGHLLGFDDSYLRGFRSLGEDGFAIIELIPDRSDIMASSGIGATQPRHFEQLVANLKADRAMRAGLAAMYEQKNPRAAIPRFLETLANRPDHYGATFQLAKALDQAGDSTTALPIWKRMLDMAVQQGDEATAKLVRSRLGIP